MKEQEQEQQGQQTQEHEQQDQDQAEQEARCLAPDNGFFFGIGVFETIALEQGVPIFMQQHIERMVTSLSRLGIAVKACDVAMLAKRACQTQTTDKSQALKLVVTEKNQFATLRRNSYGNARREQKFSCVISKVRRNETSPLTAMKTLNYADNILQKKRAFAKGYDEALFLNTKGQVAEGATSNIFAVFDKEVVTPPLSCGLLPGVMRAFVMRTIAVQERVITCDELMCANEIFLTNSLMGAMPVCRIDDCCFNDSIVAQQVHKAYEKEINKECARWKELENPWGLL